MEDEDEDEDKQPTFRPIICITETRWRADSAAVGDEGLVFSLGIGAGGSPRG